MLGEVFAYAEKRNGKAEPRYLKAEKHNENYIQDGNAAPKVIPLKAVRGFNSEPVFNCLHFNPPICSIHILQYDILYSHNHHYLHKQFALDCHHSK